MDVEGIHAAEKIITSNDVLIFQRYLGHLEIVNGHRWVERTECFICSKWIYTLVIWSQSMLDQFYESRR